MHLLEIYMDDKMNEMVTKSTDHTKFHVLKLIVIYYLIASEAQGLRCGVAGRKGGVVLAPPVS